MDLEYQQALIRRKFLQFASRLDCLLINQRDYVVGLQSSELCGAARRD